MLLLLLVVNIIGCSLEELVVVCDVFMVWFVWEGDMFDWLGMDIFIFVLDYIVCYLLIWLVFEVVVEVVDYVVIKVILYV